MSALLLLIAAMTCQVQPSTDSLSISWEVFPEDPQFGDLIYIRAIGRNTSDATLTIDATYAGDCGNLRLTGSRKGSQSTWRLVSATGACVAPSQVKLAPGESRVLVREAFGIPIDGPLDVRTWGRTPRPAFHAKSDNQVAVEITLGAESFPLAKSPKMELTISPRPAAEADLMRKLLDDAARYQNSDTPSSKYVHNSIQIGLGLRLNDEGYRVIDALLDQQEVQFTGTLGNYLHFQSQMRTLKEYSEKDPARFREAFRQLLAWCEKLPELERNALLLELGHPKYIVFNEYSTSETQQAMGTIGLELLQRLEQEVITKMESAATEIP